MPSPSLRRIALIVLALLAPACGTPAEGEAIEEIQSSLCNNQPLTIGGSLWSAIGDPSAVIFQGAAFFAFSRTDKKIQIIRETNISNSCTTTTSSSVTLTDTSAYGPALIEFNGMLHLVYVGQNRNLYMKRSNDGMTWNEATVMIGSGEDWEYRPAPNVWAGDLRVFAVSEGCNWPNCRNFLMQVDVRSPTGQPLSHVRTTWLQEYTNDSPTAATWNGVLYVSWAGTSSNKPIYIKHFDTAWSPPTIISGANGRPSLFPTSANRLTILYRGNNQIIYTVGSSDGTTFGSSQPNAATSNFSPAPFLLSSAGLWTLYTGTNGHVYTSAMLQ